jgi:hypothetical protein
MNQIMVGNSELLRDPTVKEGNTALNPFVGGINSGSTSINDRGDGCRLQFQGRHIRPTETVVVSKS